MVCRADGSGWDEAELCYADADGDGTFEKSIEALRRLNAEGYGSGDPRRRLTLMMNPVGALLTGNQCAMEREWKAALAREHGVTFDRLIALNNMPISRFLEWLEESGNLERYMELLLASFNPGTVAGLILDLAGRIPAEGDAGAGRDCRAAGI